jgi:tetratricopeptide (TPR) repeat protein
MGTRQAYAGDSARFPWRRRCVLVSLLVLFLILPHLAANGLTNAGSLALARFVLLPDSSESEERRGRLLATARACFEQALALNHGHRIARWGLGRTILAFCDYDVQEKASSLMAAEVLLPLAIDDAHNPLLYEDILAAFSHAGRPEKIIELYETNPPLGRSCSISETVALAYLQRGAPGDLVKARVLRSSDFYINYLLWQAARDVGDAGAAAIYSHALSSFPLEAVDPTDERLLDYAADVIPSLLEEGLWDQDKVRNVTSFLVWRHSGATGVEQLLEGLIECYPGNPDWPFYLGELYHRRGDLKRAEAAYRQVLEVDVDYAQAYLRLGMLYQARAQNSRGK